MNVLVLFDLIPMNGIFNSHLPHRVLPYKLYQYKVNVGACNIPYFMVTMVMYGEELER